MVKRSAVGCSQVMTVSLTFTLVGAAKVVLDFQVMAGGKALYLKCDSRNSLRIRIAEDVLKNTEPV